MGHEVDCSSTSLGLFASLSLIPSTESLVVMEWKGMSTHVTCNPGGPPGSRCCAQLTCSGMLKPFHSTSLLHHRDCFLVANANCGVAKKPSEMLNPPFSSLKDAGGRV